jgi:hypothetical protein
MAFSPNLIVALKNFILGISDICLRQNFPHALILNENSHFSKLPFVLRGDQRTICKYRIKTGAGEQFLALLMRNVLPNGFRGSRDYGFPRPRKKPFMFFSGSFYKQRLYLFCRQRLPK